MYLSAKYNIGVESNPYYNDFGFWYLSQESAEYIPIEIREGYGELYLNSLPEERTGLEVYDVVCEAVFLTAKEPVS